MTVVQISGFIAAGLIRPLWPAWFCNDDDELWLERVKWPDGN